MRYLSRDPFARVDIVRKSEHVNHSTCAWCGNSGKELKNGLHVLYRYGIEDDNNHLYLSDKLFCSKSCYDIYTN